MSRDELIALAERCEAATGRDDRLALEIARATGTVINAAPIGADGKGIEHFPDFTASIDAALTLVPEGWSVENISEWYEDVLRAKGPWMVAIYSRQSRIRDGGSGGSGDPYARCQHAKTAALAICAASLRAKAGDTQDG